MKSAAIILAIWLNGNCSLNSQPWIGKDFSYDSLLDVRYGKANGFLGNSEDLDMDIYMPSCGGKIAKPRPLILWIHGGAFLAGTKHDANVEYLCKQFARRGYVTATINYRLGFTGDKNAWNCAYPNYSCIFAADTSEWLRAMYRGIQDGKGALRYLVNRYREFNIDTLNVFVAGESAGAFIALGVALMDTAAEKPSAAFALGDLPKPASNTAGCSYYSGKTLPAVINRPDLGDIEGNIEPSDIRYKIKGVGNLFGAMSSDWLRLHKAGKPLPGIFSYHQPCDIVVPIDSDYVYWGLSWCMTNGYNCYGIKNTPYVYGGRAFGSWNSKRNYGYDIESRFTNTGFPYNFLFGTGSCADQVNKPCHAFDEQALRESQLASFFARLNSNSGPCTQINSTEETGRHSIILYPNPADNQLIIEGLAGWPESVIIFDFLGRNHYVSTIKNEGRLRADVSELSQGYYVIQLLFSDRSPISLPFNKK